MKEYIVLVPNNIKNKIIELSRIKYYNYNIKFMSIDTFIKRVTFDFDEKTIYNLMKICNGLNISLSQFFAGIEDNVDNNVLPSEQQDVLSLWNLLDSKSKEFALIYMKGLAHLPMTGVEDEKF